MSAKAKFVGTNKPPLTAHDYLVKDILTYIQKSSSTPELRNIKEFIHLSGTDQEEALRLLREQD